MTLQQLLKDQNNQGDLTVMEFHSSVLILIDLSSAFDTVTHQFLLATLAELGIPGSAFTWFKSY